MEILAVSGLSKAYGGVRALHGVSFAVAAGELADASAAPLAELAGVLRVAVDGPPCAGPHVFAPALGAPLKLRGRPVAHPRRARAGSPGPAWSP